VDWHELVERDHEIQNPTSPEKIALVGEYLRLDRSKRVLDVACGTGGPALVLAKTFGCRIHGIEVRKTFAAAARERIADAGLDGLVDVEVADASAVALEPEAWDVALCFGAAFVWGHVGDASAALVPAVVPGGGIAIGEPFWRGSGSAELPVTVGAEGFVDLPATVDRFESAGIDLTGLVAASVDDWDRYQSLHWRAAVESIASSGDEELAETHRRHRANDLARRERLGWAIFVGRKR
jgi:SAM-dependent methyltransferase